jgi:prepilin-type N-terminal cleavage/methylation domain-containing protein/prepilin-type processing-associated H-X9-DG protein
MSRLLSNRGRTTGQRKGFTLVELLVVIGIIALLISILLPALNKARAAGNDIKCLSNLRQIGMGLQQYMTTWKGRLMPVQRSGAGQFYNSHWMSVLSNQRMLILNGSGTPEGVLICPSASNTQTTDPFTTPLSPTSDMGYAVYPGKDATENFASSYAVNAFTGSGRLWNNSTLPASEWFPFVFWNPTVAAPTVRPTAANMFKVRNSTRIPLVFDGLFAHGLNANRFTTRHGQVNSSRAKDRKCNMVFLDGHAEGISGNSLPTAADNLFDWGAANPMNTNANGRWDITLIVKPIN